MTDKEIFSEICGRVREAEHIRDSIGTYSEKSVHLALKLFLEPNSENREVPVSGFIADIMNDSGIHEIQTSGFKALKKKLEAYLSDFPVEIIYPVIVERRILWLSPETGEIVEEKKSPRHMKPAEIFTELLYIGDSLYSPDLSFTIISLAADEIRLLDGYGKNGKNHATKVDIVPTGLIKTNHFTNVFSMSDLFPYSDGDTVTGADIRKFLTSPGRKGWAALKILEELGILERSGKSGNKILYTFHKK